MLRVLLVFSMIVFFFGWMAGMTLYKVLQVVFAIASIIIMLLVGSIFFKFAAPATVRTLSR
jgi:hypothetical protein